MIFQNWDKYDSDGAKLMHMSSVLTLKGGGTYPFSTVWNKTAGYTADGFAFHDIFLF